MRVTFADKLKTLMRDLDLTQSKLSELTGISKSNISQYVSGKHEPSKARRQEIALTLGVQENYFETFLPTVEIQQDGDEVVNVPVSLVAKLMGKSKKWIEEGLQQGCFPWGYAVRMKKWSYWINSKKFSEIEGIEVPLNKISLNRKEG